MQHLRGLLAGIALAVTKQTAQQRGARQFQAEGDVVQYGQVWKYRVALKDHAAAGIRFVGQRLAIEQDLAAAGRFLAEQQPQKGGFSATGRTDQGAELAFGDIQVQALQHDLIAVLLPDVLHLNEGTGVAACASQGRHGVVLAHALAPSYQGNSSWVRRCSR